MGYHVRKIRKGQLGHFSKIREEYQEFKDAYKQGNPILELCELCDLVGAIEAYTLEHYDIELSDIIQMMECTKQAFKEGKR